MTRSYHDSITVKKEKKKCFACTCQLIPSRQSNLLEERKKKKKKEKKRIHSMSHRWQIRLALSIKIKKDATRLVPACTRLISFPLSFYSYSLTDVDPSTYLLICSFFLFLFLRVFKFLLFYLFLFMVLD